MEIDKCLAKDIYSKLVNRLETMSEQGNVTDAEYYQAAVTAACMLVISTADAAGVERIALSNEKSGYVIDVQHISCMDEDNKVVH